MIKHAAKKAPQKHDDKSSREKAQREESAKLEADRAAALEAERVSRQAAETRANDLEAELEKLRKQKVLEDEKKAESSQEAIAARKAKRATAKAEKQKALAEKKEARKAKRAAIREGAKAARDLVKADKKAVVEAKKAARLEAKKIKDEAKKAANPNAKPRGRFNGMSLEEIRALYLETVGRSTDSGNKSYMTWKIREVEKGRIKKGPAEARVEGDKLSVLFNLPETLLEQFDTTWKAAKFTSRAQAIRNALKGFAHAHHNEPLAKGLDY